MKNKVAVLGHGVVGSGVAEILWERSAEISKEAGAEIILGHVVDIREFDNLPYSHLFCKSIDAVLADPETTLVAECIGGATFAFDMVAACLKAGKSVCTSNKELVATRGCELFALAKAAGVSFYYEAAVGGGIPVLRPMQRCFAGNQIVEVYGILNGTTNYILTQMADNGTGFEEALHAAQLLGYAEANPAADLQGKDALRKISILSSLAFGRWVSPADIAVQGIEKITREDVAFAKNIGCAVKLVGYCKATEDGPVVWVSPALLSEQKLLAHVNGVNNMICVTGDKVQETAFYGPGAGKEPTASAVVSDLVQLTRQSGTDPLAIWSENALKPIDCNRVVGDFYLRFMSESGASPLADFEQVKLLSTAGSAQIVALVQGVTADAIFARLTDCQLQLIAPVLY